MQRIFESHPRVPDIRRDDVGERALLGCRQGRIGRLHAKHLSNRGIQSIIT